MKKRDIVSWILSIIINLAGLYILTYKNFVKEEIKTIKVGLISLETEDKTTLKGLENKDAKKQNIIDKKIEKNQEEKEKTINEIKKEDKIEKDSIKDTERIIPEKGIEIEKKQKPSLKELKKSISNSKPTSKELIKNMEKYNPSKQNNDEIDRKIVFQRDGNGLVSGNISGTSENKNLSILWSDRNKNPEFPDEAKLKGKTGKINLKIEVDEFGNIKNYSIEEGSGVPEIDLAIEKVVGSWNLKLKNKNKIVAGEFYLDYNFDFK